MERRRFIQTGACLAGGLGIGASLTGCRSSSGSDDTGSVPSDFKTVRVQYIHDTLSTPQSDYALLTEEALAYLNTYKPGYVPENRPYHDPNDVLVGIHHKGAFALEPTSDIGIRRSANSTSYSYETTTNKDNYAIHMFYKKISDKNPYIPSHEDDIVSDNTPQYTLAALYLMVPDGTGSNETVTFNNAPREIAKALIFSTPAFQHFSREDMHYALSKFDDIFVGTYHGKLVPTATHLELAIKHKDPNENWYYYQVYREDNGDPVLRKTDSVDSNGNIIHRKGDAIYTFPLRDAFANHFQEDMRRVIQYFSADERLSSKLLPVQEQNDSALAARLKRSADYLRSRNVTYGGNTYNIDASSLKSEGLDLILNKVDGNGIHVTAKNAYNRHSSVSVIQLDKNNMPIDDQGVQELGMLSPRLALMAIPLADYSKDFTVPLHDAAHTIRFIIGSFSFNNGHAVSLYEGSAANRDTDMGTILNKAEAFTIAFEMGLTSLLILWGAHLKRDASFNSLLLTLGFQFAWGIASPFIGQPNRRGREALMPILANLGTSLLAAKNELAAILTVELAESEAEDSVPIAGQIARAINVAVDVANLSQTLYAVSNTRAVNIVDVTRKHTLKLQLKSDPKDNDFPLDIDSVRVVLSHRQNNIENSPYETSWDRSRIVSHAVAGSGTYSTYDIDIDNVPAGGVIDIDVQLKSGNWIAAQASIKNANNVDDTRIEIELKENQVPLGNHSIYYHYAMLSKSGGSYQWTVAENGGTLPSASASDDERSKNELLRISVNDPIGAIGYSYKDLSTQAYIVKNISAVIETPNQGTKSISRTDMMQLAYNMTSSNSNDMNLMFERKNGYTYVRTVNIDSQSNDFSVDFSKNVGIFVSDNITEFAYDAKHGVVAGLDIQNGVLHILNHLDLPIDDSNTNRYLNAQSSVKTRRIVVDREVDPRTQYMYNPLILTMSPSGDIVVLEKTHGGDTRLRAFDRHGSVHLDFQGFGNGTGVFTLPKEELGVNYLDINIESKGFIYVLKQVGADPTNIDNYVLDIFDPHSTTPTEPLVSTTGFSTGKIKVDYWRRVYALNYETTGDNEPTISIWLPPVPQ